MNAFSRSLQLTKLTFEVINKDRELLGFAGLSLLSSTVFFLAMLFPSVISQIVADGFEFESFHAFQFVMIGLTYFGLAFITTFFNVCVVYTTKMRFEGGAPTFKGSLDFALSRIGIIAKWSLVSASVGVLLRILQNLASRLGKVGELFANILISMIGMAWGIVTIFVVPVLVFEGLGPMQALSKSTEVIKKTWGENLVKSFGLGLIHLLAAIAILSVSLGLMSLLNAVYEPAGSWIGAGIAVLFLGITELIFGVANSVFNTALYIYAQNGQLAPGFSSELVQSVFKQK